MSLEDVREKKSSKILYVVIGFLLVGMAGFGTSQFGTGTGNSDPAALTLGDMEISSQAFNQALNTNRQRYGNVDDATITEVTLLQLRQRLALDNYLQQHRLVASDAAIDDNIKNNLNFFDNGEFSEAVFRRLVAADPQIYRAAIGQDIAKQQFQQQIVTSSVVSDVDTFPYYALNHLNRDIVIAKLPKAQFTQTASQKEIAAFYAANQDDYMTHTQVSMAYILLDPESITNSIDISEQAIDVASQPSRRAKYYLFNEESTATNAYTRLQQAQSTAAWLEALAGDIEDSGELDNITIVADEDSPISQSTVDAIFELNRVGQFTQPVMIDGSYYLFELVSNPNVPVDENTRTATKLRLQQAQAEVALAELNDKLNAAFYDTQSPNLKNISEVTGLPIKQTSLLDITQADDILAIEPLRKAIATSEKTVGKLQIPVTTDDGHVVIYRLTAVNPPKLQPLSVVNTAVEKSVIAEKTHKQLTTAADKLIAQTKVDGLTQAAAAANYATQTIENFDSNTHTAGLLDSTTAALIMQQPPMLGNLNAQQIASPTGDVYVYVNRDIRLGKISDVDSEQRQQLQKALANSLGQNELRLFVDAIEESANIKMRSGLLDEEK